MSARDRPRTVLAWALYDWGNSAFATSVMAAFFPIFFKDYWSAGVPATESTFRLGVASAAASVVVVVLAPVLGAIADRGTAKKRFLLGFAALGVVMTGALFFLSHGQWLAAAVLYALATVGFMGANTFYDALLVGVASERRVDVVSALGYALGYLGGGVLLVAHFYVVSHPAELGLADKAEAVRWCILSVGVWWALFSVPLLLFVDEPAAGAPLPAAAAVRAGFAQLARTFHELRQLKNTALFLLAYWLYIDGVDTVIRMAVDYGKSLGFANEALLRALVITQFVGIPAALAFGKLGEKIGAKRGILIGIAGYVGVCVYGAFVTSEDEFTVVAVAVGLVQGGVQALSRSLFSRLVPVSRAGEMFGFFNMLGKFAAILGPLLMGVVGRLTGSPRASILAIIVLFAAGGWVLRRVDVEAGQRAAADADAIAGPP